MGLQKFFQFLRKITNVLDKDSSLILRIVAGSLLAWIILVMAPLHIMNSGIFTDFGKELIQGCVVHKGWFTNVVAVIHIAIRVMFWGFWSWSLAFLGSATYVLLLRNYQFDILMDFYWFLTQFFHQVIPKNLHFIRQHFEAKKYNRTIIYV